MLFGNTDKKKSPSGKETTQSGKAELTKHLEDFFGSKDYKLISPKIKGLIYGVVLLSIFGSFYYFIYINKREQDFNQQRFRSLHTLSENLVERYIEMTSIQSDQMKDNVIQIDTLGGDINNSILAKAIPVSFDTTGMEDDPVLYNLLPYDALVESITPYALFDFFLIIKDGSIVFHDINNGLISGELDILKNIETPKVQDVFLADTKYKAYNHHFDFTKADFNFIQRIKQIKSSNKSPVNQDKAALQSIKKYIQGDWTIIGFISQKSIKKEITKVNIWFVIVLTISILIILASLPILKLLLVGEIELITAKDAFLSALSIIIGLPLIVVVLLGLFHYANFFEHRSQVQLEKVNNHIRDAFHNELDSMILQLDMLDQRFVQSSTNNLSDSTTRINLSNLINSTTKAKYEPDKGNLITSFSDPAHFYPYNEVSWINAGINKVEYRIGSGSSESLQTEIREFGKQVIQFSPFQANQMINLENRDYFQKVISDELWNYGDSVKRKIYLQSVVSWFSGDREAVLSSRSRDSSKVIMISSAMSSVFNTVLPPPYKFALIDHSGQVQFHSISERNINENFLHEVDAADRQLILSNIELYRSGDFTSNYWGERIHGYFHPIKGVPFYLITYYEMSESRLFISEVLSTTLIFYLIGILALIVVAASSLIWNRKYRRFVKIKRYAYDWLRPKKVNYLKYLCLTFLFLLFSIFMVIRIIETPYSFPQNYVFELMIPSISFVIIYAVLKKPSFLQFLVKALTLTSLVYLTIRFLGNTEFSKQERLEVWYPLTGICIGYLFLKLWLHYKKKYKSKFDQWKKGKPIFNNVLSKRFERPRDNKHFKLLKNDFSNWNARLASSFESQVILYKAFISIWIISCFVMPITQIFYKASKDENHLWQRYSQVNVALNLEDKIKGLSEKYIDQPNAENSFVKPITDSVYISEKIEGGNYLDSLGMKMSFISKNDFDLGSSKVKPFIENVASLEVRKRLRPLFGATSYYLSNALVDKGSANNNVFWLENKIGDSTWIPRIDTKRDSVAVRDSTWVPPNDTRPDSVLVLQDTNSTDLYFSSNKAIRGKQKILLVSGSLLDQTTNKSVIVFLVLTLITICIYSVFLIHIMSNALFGFKFWFIRNRSSAIDFTSTLKKTEWAIFVIITPGRERVLSNESFEFVELKLGITETEIHKIYKKLVELEEAKQKTIISSYYYPSFILEDYVQTLRKVGKEGLVEELIRIFGSTPQYIAGYDIPPNEEPRNNEFLKKNLVYFEHLRGSSEENTLLGNESISHSHYSLIWHTLSDREKYALYDISIDGFLNTKNVKPIRNLIYKGIIGWKEDKSGEGKSIEGLNIFNSSFRNFILSVVAKDYGRKIKQEINQRSTWASLSMIIYVLIAAAIVFIGLSEPDFFNDFNSFISVVAGIVTILPTASTFLIRKA